MKRNPEPYTPHPQPHKLHRVLRQARREMYISFIASSTTCIVLCNAHYMYSFYQHMCLPLQCTLHLQPIKLHAHAFTLPLFPIKLHVYYFAGKQFRRRSFSNGGWCDAVLAGFLPALRPYPEHSRANSYPWSPFPPRRARPGPGPHKYPHRCNGRRGRRWLWSGGCPSSNVRPSTT